MKTRRYAETVETATIANRAIVHTARAPGKGTAATVAGIAVAPESTVTSQRIKPFKSDDGRTTQGFASRFVLDAAAVDIVVVAPDAEALDRKIDTANEAKVKRVGRNAK